MSDTKNETFGLLEPGNIFEFGNITELPDFEDFVAGEVEPGYDPDRWAGRVALRDLIRPPKFNGAIANIRMQVMDEPYERLLDASERGWRVRSSHRALSSEFADELIPRYKGFTFSADAMSSGRGVVGQIQAELWYYPLFLRKHIYKTGETYTYRQPGKTNEYTTTRRVDSVSIKATANFGEALHRAVAKPKYEKEKFIELDETARRIGMGLVRQALTHQISTPMRD